MTGTKPMASPKGPFLLVCALPLLNLVFWRIGVVMDTFGGSIHEGGARLCRLTYVIAATLVVLSLILGVARLRRSRWWLNWMPAVMAILSLTVIKVELTWLLRESAS